MSAELTTQSMLKKVTEELETYGVGVDDEVNEAMDALRDHREEIRQFMKKIREFKEICSLIDFQSDSPPKTQKLQDAMKIFSVFDQQRESLKMKDQELESALGKAFDNFENRSAEN